MGRGETGEGRTSFARSELGVCVGTASPLWGSLEGFLEQSVLNLNVGAGGLAPGPSHHWLVDWYVPAPCLPSHAQPRTLAGRGEGCPAVGAEGGGRLQFLPTHLGSLLGSWSL